ncbi:MAG TPA: transglycosylase SLT domain-containing protein [Fibrobacteraceae bacterium]|nr:transglycosylase SLT domain-containing protein [Fibrobacteraceae bacterium]
MSMLRYEDYREQVIRKPLLEAAMSDSTQEEGVRNLAKASLFFRANQYDSAYALYRAHQKDIPQVEGQLLMRASRCALELGWPDTARALLMSKPSMVKNRPWWEQTDRLILESILRDSVFSDSAKLDSVSARIGAKPRTSYLAWLNLQQGQLWLQLQVPDSAQASFLRALESRDWRDSALAQLNLLANKIGYPKSTLERTRVVLNLCNAGQDQKCVQEVDSLLTRPDLPAEKRTVLWASQAAALQGMKKLDSAAVRYRWLLDSVELRPGWLQSLMRISRKLRRTREADQLDSLFQQQFPYSSENANNLWVKALELEQDESYVESFLEYAHLKDQKFGRNLRRQWAPFRMGLVWYKQGLFEEAAQVLAEPAHDPSFAWPQAASLLFRGECYWALRQDSAARQAYLATVQAFPLSWYAHRARMRLQETGLLDSAQVPWMQILDLSDSQSVVWLRKHMKRNRRLEKGCDERIQLIQLLYRTGFEDEARSLLQRSINAFGRRVDFLFEAGRMLELVGETGESFRMARLLLEIADRHWFYEMPRPVAELVYPLPEHWMDVAREYVKTPLDPYFLFGVMRQESIFVPNITSPVGARGLMQIMPSTGRTLAKAEHIRGFRDELLYNPVMSIRLGSRYLADLLLDYGGDPVYALANYNAGPGPAKRWQNANEGKSLDLAVEDISYWETREYVKKVMGNYWTYQAIYP